MDLYYKLMQEEDKEKIKDIIADELSNFSIEVITDNTGNIILHKRGNGKKIMISALINKTELCISAIDSDNNAEFELSGNTENSALRDIEVLYQGNSIGVVRIKNDDKKDNKENTESYIELWDKNLINIGDNCCIKKSCSCKGDLLYGIDVSAILPTKIITNLAKIIKNSVNDIYFTVSFFENGVKSAVQAIKPDCLYCVYCVKSSSNFSISDGCGIVYKEGNAVIAPDVRNFENNIALNANIKTQPYVGKQNKLIEVLEITGNTKRIGAICIPVKHMGSGCEVADAKDIEGAEKLLLEILSADRAE